MENVSVVITLEENCRVNNFNIVDDGKTVDGPGELATRAFLEGITKVRVGKGFWSG